MSVRGTTGVDSDGLAYRGPVCHVPSVSAFQFPKCAFLSGAFVDFGGGDIWSCCPFERLRISLHAFGSLGSNRLVRRLNRRSRAGRSNCLGLSPTEKTHSSNYGEQQDHKYAVSLFSGVHRYSLTKNDVVAFVDGHDSSLPAQLSYLLRGFYAKLIFKGVA
ncbi:MAG: hypothetical protein H6R18_1260 [Proteobacteria bacterium]|nr:hypothetical protein [Pseudomonadota bacterium]